jgi:hypothetical protein
MAEALQRNSAIKIACYNLHHSQRFNLGSSHRKGVQKNVHLLWLPFNILHGHQAGLK